MRFYNYLLAILFIFCSTLIFSQKKDKDKEDDEKTCPIELISFSFSNGTFKWSTASETNNKFFILQSSSDCRTWNNEEYIMSNGNSTQIVEYSFKLDPKYEYWRLTQEDWDGKFESFQPIHVDLHIYVERIFDLQMNEVFDKSNLRGIYLVLRGQNWTKIWF